ncbi:MAG TPA: hypothetical protein VGH34_04600 [Vicinamibacterales bacterium]|jgi:hypothetical protein
MLLGLLLSTQIVCQNGVISTNYSRILGVEFASSLTCAELEAAPRWTETQSNPPLSARDALAAAKAALPKIVENPAMWDFGALELRPMIVPDTWVWIVQFYVRPTGPLGGVSQSLRIVVLMNGHVIEPVRR